MRHLPTLIVTAGPSAPTTGSPMDCLHPLVSTLTRLLACDLPIVLVGDDTVRDATRHLLPDKDILTLRYRSRHPADQQVEALVEGLLARSQAPSWLLIPGLLPRLEVSTVLAVASALTRYPLAYAEHRQQRGVPLGFASELFSELIQLNSHRDLERFKSRYPACSVEVDDPGVLMDPTSLMSPMRTPHHTAEPHAGIHNDRH